MRLPGKMMRGIFNLLNISLPIPSVQITFTTNILQHSFCHLTSNSSKKKTILPFCSDTFACWKRTTSTFKMLWLFNRLSSSTSPCGESIDSEPRSHPGPTNISSIRWRENNVDAGIWNTNRKCWRTSAGQTESVEERFNLYCSLSTDAVWPASPAFAVSASPAQCCLVHHSLWQLTILPCSLSQTSLTENFCRVIPMIRIRRCRKFSTGQLMLVANPEIRMASKFKAFGDGRDNHSTAIALLDANSDSWRRN